MPITHKSDGEAESTSHELRRMGKTGYSGKRVHLLWTSVLGAMNMETIWREVPYWCHCLHMGFELKPLITRQDNNLSKIAEGMPIYLSFCALASVRRSQGSSPEKRSTHITEKGKEYRELTPLIPCSTGESHDFHTTECKSKCGNIMDDNSKVRQNPKSD